MWLTEAQHEEFCPRIPEEPQEPQEPEETEETQEPVEPIEDEDPEYIPPPAVKTGGRLKAPLSAAMDRNTLDRRVDAVIPPLQDIADAENTTL